jgi:anti-sigma factor RsiW
MNCDRALELISARVDYELLFDDEALNEHLAACAACRQALATVRRLDESLSQVFAPERAAAGPLGERIKASLADRA